MPDSPGSTSPSRTTIDEVPRYPVPQQWKGQFLGPADAAGFQENLGPWKLAPELRTLAYKVAEEASDRGARIDNDYVDRTVFFWKGAGGATGGKPRYGKAVKLTQLAKWFADSWAGLEDYDRPDFVIWLAADHLTSATEATIKAVLLHELLHLDEDDNGNPTLAPHDVTSFHKEVLALGLWSPDLRRFAEHAQAGEQLRLAQG